MEREDNERECLANAEVVSIYAKKFGIGQMSYNGPSSEKKWYSMEENSPYSMEENSPQGIWDHNAEKMLVEFAESGCPIFRVTTPLSRGYALKQRTRKNCRYILLLIIQQLRLFFA